MRLLLAARNVRSVEPRCCNTCVLFAFSGDGMAACQRPGGPEFDVGDRRYDYTVCDLWRSHYEEPEGHSRASELIDCAQIVLRAHGLPETAARAMLPDPDGAALLALLCNAAAKVDPALYVYKSALIGNAVTQGRKDDRAIWKQAHRFEQQQYTADTVVCIETGVGRMQWHVCSADPEISDLLAVLPERRVPWTGVSMQAIARELAVTWLVDRGVA